MRSNELLVSHFLCVAFFMCRISCVLRWLLYITEWRTQEMRHEVLVQHIDAFYFSVYVWYYFFFISTFWIKSYIERCFMKFSKRWCDWLNQNIFYRLKSYVIIIWKKWSTLSKIAIFDFSRYYCFANLNEFC